MGTGPWPGSRVTGPWPSSRATGLWPGPRQRRRGFRVPPGTLSVFRSPWASRGKKDWCYCLRLPPFPRAGMPPPAAVPCPGFTYDACGFGGRGGGGRARPDSPALRGTTRGAGAGCGQRRRTGRGCKTLRGARATDAQLHECGVGGGEGARGGLAWYPRGWAGSGAGRRPDSAGRGPGAGLGCLGGGWGRGPDKGGGGVAVRRQRGPEGRSWAGGRGVSGRGGARRFGATKRGEAGAGEG